MSLSAEEILIKYKKIVWPEVQKYLVDPKYPEVFNIPKKYDKDLHKYWKIVKEYPERQGKYLRPTLLLLAVEAMGFNYKKALKIAAAMQISEDWLLIHDDIQDHSLARRGSPTLHELYGTELAIDAGDTLHVIMWKAILDNRKVIGDEKTFALAEEFYRVIKRTADGQAIELMWSNQNKIDFEDEDSLFIADGKTAYYTIAAPLRLGAIVAGANEEQLELLAKFGLYLGRCFQLVDDILDLTVDYKGKGQKMAGDIYGSKRTLILSHLARNLRADERKKLSKILKKNSNQKSKSEVEWTLLKMKEYKSIEYAKKIANELKDISLKIFETELEFLSQEPARSQIREIITFIVNRDH